MNQRETATGRMTLIQRTTYVVRGMDCPSEEHLIRMALSSIPQVMSVHCTIDGRRVSVVHERGTSESGEIGAIATAIAALNLGCERADVEVVNNDDANGGSDRSDRRLLWQVLSINAGFFIVETVVGTWAGSLGLIADGLDMLADSFVYGLALFAVGANVHRKIRIAHAAGYAQMLLAVFGIVDVIRRFLGAEVPPDFMTMIVVSALALAGNAMCLVLLRRNDNSEAHMKASMIFTSNDVIANAGVIVAGILVFFTGSMIPDLLIGLAVFVLVSKGALAILSLK